MSAPVVLLVDDEPNLLRALSFALARTGLVVETADNGLTGLEMARRLRPDVIVLDVMMPGMDGFEVCAEVKADPDLAGTHVVMLSARSQLLDRERGELAGADEYVTKPFSPRDLVTRVSAAIARPAA